MRGVRRPVSVITSYSIHYTKLYEDHVAAMPGLVAALAAAGIPVRTYAPEADRDYFGARARETNERVFSGIGAMGFMRKQWVPIPEADEYYGDGFAFPGLDAVAIHTPGHTRGSSCFLVEVV